MAHVAPPGLRPALSPAPVPQAGEGKCRAGWLRLAVWLALCLCCVAAHGGPRAELAELQVERTDDGLYLSARVQLDLPAAVQDALRKGIAVHFVADAQILRERWYWYDREMAAAQRHMRLAYQPLTGRWRLNTSSEPISDAGLGVSLTQYYDTLADALAAVQRIARWRIAEAGQLEAGGRQTVRFRFSLDASRLPRTFQLGAIGDADWELSVQRSIDLTQERAR